MADEEKFAKEDGGKFEKAGRHYVPPKPSGAAKERLEEGRTMIPKPTSPSKPHKDRVEKGRVYVPPKTPPKTNPPPSKPKGS